LKPVNTIAREPVSEDHPGGAKGLEATGRVFDSEEGQADTEPAVRVPGFFAAHTVDKMAGELCLGTMLNPMT
jgi:hypothetical protein